MLDIAAGRVLPSATPLTSDGLVLAHQHGLVGLIASATSAELKRRALPSFTRLTARQQVMLRHLRRVLGSFDRAGIPAAVVKGPDLASRIYRVSAHRTFTDVDLLVRPDDLPRALDVLAEDPAVRNIPAQGPKADKRNVPLTDPSGVRFTLDLHWDLFSYTQLQGAADGATESAWLSADGPVDTDLGRRWPLPEAAVICFLCTHALLDHRFRLILFRDLTEVALHHPDWDEVARFAHRWGLRSSTYIALLMASRVTDATVPAEFVRALRPGTTPIAMTERLLPRTDLVRFDGHRPHPLNLAIVLLHDSALRRIQLAARALVAFPDWRRRVGLGTRRRSRRPRIEGRSIVVLITTDRRRGAEVFGERLANALGERGWDSNLLALSHEASGPRVQAQVVTSRSPDQLGRLDLRVVRDLRDTLASLRPGVVLANGSATLQYALAASRTLPGPVRVVYSSIGEPMYWIRGRARRLMQRALLSQADLVVAVSESTKRQLLDGVGLPEGSVEVAPTGVPDLFFAIPSRQASNGPLRLLFMGNLSREKNPMAVLEVTRRLAATLEVQLRFVGEGPLQQPLQAKVAAFGLGDVVRFEGSVEDVAPHLGWADLLILTSETEGLPGVVLEAAAAGVPAVAFAVGGAAETIRDGVTGVLIPPGDLESLASTISTLARDRPRLAAMGDRARQFVAERYSFDSAVDRYEQLLLARVKAPLVSTDRAPTGD